ncbi:DUF2975 domain-containing protein [Chryseobacterium paridis]|uniref:DUF2975 domain-containing protein n=1 Tax=Chryseobacterium paridis TaxID=2800328 RepID=A0ABS1G0H8_9FLAO|nr:DUF2975 domain-containing protein [Chryseobacterium paridis]MBK1898145.1 DUF2975 domain-containing protein [Chryseobacterium paridis]
MKLLGKKSISTAISYVLFFLFIFFAFHFIYELFGYGISYYNLKTGSHIFSETFYAGDTISWGESIPGKDHLFFRFKYPFTDTQMLTGLFNFKMFLNNLLQITFVTLFFFSTYKIFNGMSKNVLFNPEVIKWLKRFSLLNIIYVPLLILNWVYNFTPQLNLSILLTSFTFLFLGTMVYFIVEFFKKGLELQQQADLTI